MRNGRGSDFTGCVAVVVEVGRRAGGGRGVSC